MPARQPFHHGVTIIAILALACMLVMLEPAWAQIPPRGPFGLGEGRPTAPPSGFVGWILLKQAEFHRALIAALNAAKAGQGAGWLISAGFLYGAFHAAGPGHGKAVVSSYVFANERTVRRGIALSFAAAFIQALIAIALVWFALSILETTARNITGMVRNIEIVSFGLIALFGAGLTWRKARAFYAALKQPAPPENCDECGRFRLSYKAKSAPAEAMPACGHVVMPAASEVSRAGDWASFAAIAFAAGSRPCTGAILILVLAWSSSIFPIGIAAVFAMALGTALATSGFALAAAGAKGIARRLSDGSEHLRPLVAGLELLAALIVLLLGVSLLLGYLAGD